jgi:hypothetical protein
MPALPFPAAWDSQAVRLPPMPWRIWFIVACLGVGGGALFGFARGLSYLPTLPFAIVEGGILIGVPANLLGLALTGIWSLGSAARERRRRDTSVESPRRVAAPGSRHLEP